MLPPRRATPRSRAIQKRNSEDHTNPGIRARTTGLWAPPIADREPAGSAPARAAVTIVVGLVVCVLLAAVAATVSLGELTTVSQELERHTEAAQREGFANRQLERVEDLTGEAEARFFEGLVDPPEGAAAPDSMRTHDALLREVRRAAAVLEQDVPGAFVPLLEAARAVDVELAIVRSEIADSGGPATAERRMAEELLPALSKLQDVLHRARSDLLRGRC